MGLNFLVGFESEVVFLSNLNPPTPIDNTTYATTAAFHSVKHCEMIEEIVSAISGQGIGISQFHAESGPGQVHFFRLL